MFTYAKPIDGITVCEEMQKGGTYDENTTRSYLAQLMEITPTSANVMEYVAIVRDKALLRGVAQAAAEITAMVQEGVGEASRNSGGGGAEGLRRPPGPERPGHGAPAAGAAGRAGPAGRDEREREPPAGPLHGPVRCGPEDHGPEQVGPDPAGGPARHGQDLLCAEHRAERGQEPPTRPWRSSPWR